MCVYVCVMGRGGLMEGRRGGEGRNPGSSQSLLLSTWSCLASGLRRSLGEHVLARCSRTLLSRPQHKPSYLVIRESDWPNRTTMSLAWLRAGIIYKRINVLFSHLHFAWRTERTYLCVDIVRLQQRGACRELVWPSGVWQHLLSHRKPHQRRV